MMKRKELRQESGFTLIELMTVVAILSTLAVIAIPVLTGLVERAHRAAVVSDLRNAATSLSEYQAHNGRYPIDGEVTILTSDRVTVTISHPTVVTDALWFCLEGEHDDIPGGVVGTFDTRAGGLTPSASC